MLYHVSRVKQKIFENYSLFFEISYKLNENINGYLVSINGSKAYGFVIIGISEKEISSQTKKRLQQLFKHLSEENF